MPLGVVDGYLVDVPEEGSSTITVLDGSGDSFSPTEFLTVAADQESGNVRHELLDGGIAMALVDSRPQEGTLELLFSSDAAAAAARSILARPSTFTLTVPERPALGMTFARFGSLSPTPHLSLDGVWTVRVGFQEV